MANISSADGFRLRRLKALAQFGVKALRSTDLQATLDEACRHAAQGLDAPVAKILEVLPGGSDLLLRAAVGLPPEVAVPGISRIPAGRRSAAGYAIETGRPVISDIADERRFEVSAIVRAIGARHSINVVIFAEDLRFGALEVDRLDDRGFTDLDVAFLQSYANVLGAAVIRHQAAARVATLVQERETLLRELQHRVKNDLQTVNSLIMLERREAQEIETQARLDRLWARLDSLRRVHDQLFARKAAGRIDLADYLRELALERLRMHGLDPAGPVRLELQLSEALIDAARAIPVGLIANEFLTNSLKYAFPSGTGTIRIAAEPAAGGQIRVSFADDGIGIPKPAPRSAGHGLRLIALLAQQIGATAEHGGSETGTQLSLTFPAAEPSQGAARGENDAR